LKRGSASAVSGMAGVYSRIPAAESAKRRGKRWRRSVMHASLRAIRS